MALGGSDDLRNYFKQQKLQKKRTVRVVACVFFTLVFLLFVGGTTWSLTTSDYPWVDGELAAEIITIVGSLLLAVFTGFRARSYGRQAATLEAQLSLQMISLPPAEDSVDADIQAQTPRLRTYSRRAAAICAAWVVALLLGASGFVLLNETGQRLLDQGTQTAGTVVSVHNARARSSSIMVRYMQGDIDRTTKIYRDSNRNYTPGLGVTVFYDRADPGRVRTLDERNDNQFVTWSAYLLVIVACVMVPFSVLAARGWRRRYQAVRISGWRKGAARVSQHSTMLAEIAVKYRDGSRIALKAVTSLHAPHALGESSGVPVWVGGAGRDMVVLMPRRGVRKAFHAVPVRVAGPRARRPARG
jgi:hypothetical protein